jgi:hypothetical protein
MIRFEIDTIFAVRPRKGERRHNGRLLKTSVCGAVDLAEARAEYAAAVSRGNDYSAPIAFRAYDWDAFMADPLNTKPIEAA